MFLPIMCKFYQNRSLNKKISPSGEVVPLKNFAFFNIFYCHCLKSSTYFFCHLHRLHFFSYILASSRLKYPLGYLVLLFSLLKKFNFFQVEPFGNCGNCEAAKFRTIRKKEKKRRGKVWVQISVWVFYFCYLRCLKSSTLFLVPSQLKLYTLLFNFIIVLFEIIYFVLFWAKISTLLSYLYRMRY